MDEYQNMDGVLGALADLTRRSILQQLMGGPARVTELARPHAMSLNSISKHLKILEKVKLVQREVRGRDHWISFNGAPLHEIRAWTSNMLEFWETRFDSLEALLAAENDKEKNNGRR
jgi:DNA-binding transcriptional ArsR family regulator